MILEYPLWFILFCILLGLGYALLLYRKDHHLTEAKPWLKKLLGTVRFLAVTILAFLLLGPLLKTVFQEIEKPIIIIAADNSQSLLLSKDSIEIQTKLTTQLAELKQELDADFEVVAYSFGDVLEAGLLGEFNQKVTNLSDVFDEFYTRYNHRNIGALVLATDGIYNQGSSPVYSMRDLNFPIYTVALGDTAQRKDLRLAEVRHNKLAYLGNKFPLEILVEAVQLKSERIDLEILQGGRPVYSEHFTSTTDQFRKTISVNLEAAKTGLQKYSVRLKAIKGETILINNIADIYIDVINSRQKILIVGAAPHPDIGAIREALLMNDNYEVTTKLIDDFDDDIGKYSLAIFHQLPSKKNQAMSLIAQASAKHLPVLFVLGAQSDITSFNKVQKAYQVANPNGNLNESHTAYNKDFSLFKMELEHTRKLEQYPPLHVPFGTFKKSESATALLNQRIGFVATDDPLLLFQKLEDQKIGIITGEGIWRWLLVNYAEDQNHDVFNTLIGKVAQYLASKEDKSFFRVFGKNKFAENEPLIFNAELYNKSYDPVNDPDVSFVIRNEAGKDFSYAFSKVENAYRLNAGLLPVGEYSYSARTVLNGEEFKEAGVFSIAAVRLEAGSLTADHQLLYTLSTANGGKMVYQKDIATLAEEISNKSEISPRIYSKKNLAELISEEWVFALVLALLSLEWFLRKRNGAY